MGDVVLVMFASTMAVGEVYFHATVNGTAYTCLSQWDTVESDAHTMICRVRDAPIILRTSAMLESVVYSRAPVGGVSHVLLPIIRRL